MVYKNTRIYDTQEKAFKSADIVIEDGRFASIDYICEICEIDHTNKIMQSQIIIPGFVDIHSHGAAGIDMMSATSGELVQMSEYYAQNGVTTLFPSTVSDSRERILRMIDEVKKARKLARIDFAGIHLEGPYINKNKAGAHSLNYIRDVDMGELSDICEATLEGGLRLHVTLAPEIGGGLDAVKFLISRGATVTLGHTEANAETIAHAIKLGAGSFTHLFNAMPGIHHRDAGVAVHAINSPACVELICDGIHVCPEVISLTVSAKGLDKIIIVSDSMSAAGLPEGEYNLGQSAVTMTNGKVVITGTDTIAGSVANLCGELQNFMKFTGVSFEGALPTATSNPARCVGLYDTTGGSSGISGNNGIGSIEEGKSADFIVWDTNINGIREVYAKGERVF